MLTRLSVSPPRRSKFLLDLHPKPPSCGSPSQTSFLRLQPHAMRGLIEFVRHATARHNSETEGTKTNAKQSLLGFKIDDNFRITSLTSQFVFKAESGRSEWIVYYLLSHRWDNNLFLHVSCLLPNGCPALECWKRSIKMRCFNNGTPAHTNHGVS